MPPSISPWELWSGAIRLDALGRLPLFAMNPTPWSVVRGCGWKWNVLAHEMDFRFGDNLVTQCLRGQTTIRQHSHISGAHTMEYCSHTGIRHLGGLAQVGIFPVWKICWYPAPLRKIWHSHVILCRDMTTMFLSDLRAIYYTALQHSGVRCRVQDVLYIDRGLLFALYATMEPVTLSAGFIVRGDCHTRCGNHVNENITVFAWSYRLQNNRASASAFIHAVTSVEHLKLSSCLWATTSEQIPLRVREWKAKLSTRCRYWTQDQFDTINKNGSIRAVCAQREIQHHITLPGLGGLVLSIPWGERSDTLTMNLALWWLIMLAY